MTHHLLTEDHIHLRCLYCNHDLCDHAWQSEWNADHHYKWTVCDSCGKKTHKAIEFQGSGHDRWHERAFSGLENKAFEKSREK